jgi:hypothetical protein
MFITWAYTEGVSSYNVDFLVAKFSGLLTGHLRNRIVSGCGLKAHEPIAKHARRFRKQPRFVTVLHYSDAHVLRVNAMKVRS